MKSGFKVIFRKRLPFRKGIFHIHREWGRTKDNGPRLFYNRSDLFSFWLRLPKNLLVELTYWKV